MEKCLGFGQVVGLKEIPDGGSEGEDIEFLLRISDGHVVAVGGMINGADFVHVGRLLRRIRQRRRREQGDGIGLSGREDN